MKVTQVYQAKAKKIGVTLQPSKDKDKKFAVFKDGKFQTNIGASGYKDFESYKKIDTETALARREAYRSRHAKDLKIKYRDGKLTAGYLANKILW
jgi:hypothetical protein